MAEARVCSECPRPARRGRGGPQTCSDACKTAKDRARRAAYKRNRVAQEKTHKRASNRRRKDRALAILGGKCVRCGMDNPLCLQIDHINGDGRFRRGTSYTYLDVLAGRTEGLQVLCANCHMIKTIENNEYSRWR